MVASAWTVYDTALEYLMDGSFDLDTDTFTMALFTSASNAATTTLSILSEVTNQVANGNGYTTGGQNLSAVTWAAGASARQLRLDATANVWSASGGNIANVRYAVIYDNTHASDALLCQAALSTAQFTITDGNTLTVTPSATGIFNLTQS